MLHPTPQWVQKLRGRFVVFDGPDGSGKSTQCGLCARFVAGGGVEVCQVREPGGTRTGERIREILLSVDDSEPIDLTCEMLLFMASRAQLMAQCIRPALAEGQMVLADRFVSSTLAYQGGAAGLPLDQIHRVAEVALGGCGPDLVVIFDVDEGTVARRLGAKPKRTPFKATHEPTLFSDRMEGKDAEYHRAVRHAYLKQAKANPNRYAVVDASGDEEAVFKKVVETLADRFEGNKNI